MPLELIHSRPVVLVRQSAFENSGIARSAIDQRYNLTADEFQAQDGLVLLGPLPSDDLLSTLISDLEAAGLVYFDDFFELSGNWPEWLALYARGVKASRP